MRAVEIHRGVLRDVSELASSPRTSYHGAEAIPDISVVVPLYNEECTLVELYDQVRSVCEQAALSFELIYVDDGSDDRSGDVLRSLVSWDYRVRALTLRRNFGKSAALATGFRASQGSAVITMDADLQDDPAEIPRLLTKLAEGYGLVSGWKRERRDPLSKRLPSKVFNSVTRRLSRVRLHDFNCGLKAYSRECAAEVSESCYGEMHRYLPVVAHHKGFRVAEIPVNHRARLFGKSKFGLERYVRGMLDLFTAVFMSRYTRRPMHVFGGLGMSMLVPGTACLLWLVLDKVLLGASLGGRPLLLLAGVLCISGLQLVLTGLLAELIAFPNVRSVPYRQVGATEIDATTERYGDAGDQATLPRNGTIDPRAVGGRAG